MSLYHNSFNYLGKNSQTDFGLIVSHLDGGDSGETETFLQMDPVFTDNYLGTRRIDYGAKYSSVAVFNITLIKQSGGDFSVQEIRDCLKWLTGAQSNSNLELKVNDEVKYFFTGRFTNASHYKMDARTIGLILEFTSIAPWAYSAPQIVEYNASSEESLSIDCKTDDLYSYVYMKTTYANSSSDSVVIKNIMTGDETKINNLVANEVVTLDNNMTIVSDNSVRVFGNDFNFVFPRLQAGVNEFEITGDGDVTFEYIYPIKLGNVAIDVNAYSDPICDDDGYIQIDTLPWDRISGKPELYTKDEIDAKLKEINSQPGGSSSGENVDLTDYYTKDEIDEKFDNLTIPETVELSWNNITDKPTTLEEYGLKEEVNTLLSSIAISIDEEELNAMLGEVLA